MFNEARIGRPPVYTGSVRRHIATLIRRHNASRARTILNARKNNPLASKRNLDLVPTPLGISMPTMRVIAQESGIELKRGRPPVRRRAA